MRTEISQSRLRARPKRLTLLCVGMIAVLIGLFFPTLIIAVFESLCAIECLQYRGPYRRLYLVTGVTICLLAALQFVIFFTGLSLPDVRTLFMG